MPDFLIFRNNGLGKDRPQVTSFPQWRGPCPELSLIHIFILDFDRDIYDKTEVLEVHFLVRGVMKFRNLQEVRNQVQKDLQKVRDQLNAIYANYQE